MVAHPDQVADQLHLLQQQADDDEPCVVAQLLHHQVAAILLVRPRVVASRPDRRVEAERFVQVVRLARAKATEVFG